MDGGLAAKCTALHSGSKSAGTPRIRVGAQGASVTVILWFDKLQRTYIHRTSCIAVIPFQVIAVYTVEWVLFVTLAVQDTRITNLSPKNDHAHNDDAQGENGKKPVKYFHICTPFINRVWIRVLVLTFKLSKSARFNLHEAARQINYGKPEFFATGGVGNDEGRKVKRGTESLTSPERSYLPGWRTS